MSSTATHARIYSETMNHLGRHLSRVKEGRDVDGAKFFANWLIFSGIITLCKEHASAPNELSPLKCDGAFLEGKCKDLLFACGEYYRTCGKAEGIGATELESLHEKVNRLLSNQDLIAGHVSKLTPPSPSEMAVTVATMAAKGRGGGVAAPLPLPLSLSTCHNCIEDEKSQ